MFEKRVGRIHTFTRYPQLFHKEIHRIDLDLVEAHLMNDGPNFFAKGIIHRQIRYIELDGSLRKLDDKIQFVLLMGKSVTGSLFRLQTELIQNYFIFQSAPDDAHAAILEQEMILNINQNENLDKFPKSNQLRINSIIQQGQESIFVQIPFKPVTPWSWPTGFIGTINFLDCTHLPVAVVEIKGSVHEKTSENILQESLLKEKVGVLIKAPSPKDKEELKISGTVKEIDWQADSTGRSGKITLQLDYQWHLTAPKELSCLVPGSESEGDFSVEQIETLLLVESRFFHFFNTVQIEVPQLKSLNEIQLMQLTYKSSWTQKGILLHADLTWGITFVNFDGVEEYQEYKTCIDELFSDIIQEDQRMKPTLAADLQNRIVEYAVLNREIKIIVDFQYSPKIYKKKITMVVKDDASSELIDAKVLVGENTYAFNGSEKLNLKFQPFRIISLKGKLVKASSQAQNGCLSIQGMILVELTFFDPQGKIHEDFFQSYFKNFYTWDQLIPEMKMEVDGDLKYDHFQRLDMNIEYQYLVTFVVKAFHQKVIGVRTVNNLPQLISQNMIAMKQNAKSCRFLEDLVLDWDRSLPKGNLQEIAMSQVHIAGFEYRNSQNAILVRGRLTGDLEYWDQKKYLQKLLLDLPFWRFIPKSDGWQVDHCKLIPEIRNCSYYPLWAFPWRKGSIKIHLELRLAQMREDELI